MALMHTRNIIVHTRQPPTRVHDYIYISIHTMVGILSPLALSNMANSI